MDKLTLEHLAPYLPYKLKCECTEYTKISIGLLDALSCTGRWINSVTILIDKEGKKVRQLKNIKPILRPLSDITEEIANKYGYYNVRLFMISIKEQEIQIKRWNNLLAEHWDVHNLIPASLAIDINTIKN